MPCLVPQTFHVLLPWLRTLKLSLTKKMISVDFIYCNSLIWLFLLIFMYCPEITLSKNLYHARNKRSTPPKKNIYMFTACNLSRLLFIQVENYCLRNCYIMIQPYSTQQVEVYLSKMCNYPFKYIYLWLQMNLRVYLLICCRSQNWDVQYIERTVPLPCPVPLIESLAFSHAAQLELSILFSTVL